MEKYNNQNNDIEILKDNINFIKDILYIKKNIFNIIEEINEIK